MRESKPREKNKGEDEAHVPRITQRMRKVKKCEVRMETQFSFGGRKHGWRLYYFRKTQCC
jgi:hypothetical protein